MVNAVIIYICQFSIEPIWNICQWNADELVIEFGECIRTSIFDVLFRFYSFFLSLPPALPLFAHSIFCDFKNKLFGVSKSNHFCHNRFSLRFISARLCSFVRSCILLFFFLCSAECWQASHDSRLAFKLNQLSEIWGGFYDRSAKWQR